MTVKVHAAVALARLEAMGDPATLAGRSRFGIPETDAFGVPLPAIRKLARDLGRDHALAKALWASGKHEARILASLVADPERLTIAQAQRWLDDVESWDVCDALAYNLFDRAPWALEQAPRWMAREEEWVKRAGFAMVAGVAVHDKTVADARILPLVRVVEKHADDERNYVKKAASWALRQIGKRSAALHAPALAAAERLAAKAGKGARWVGHDAARELRARKPA